jgi:hypothetical protein
MRSNNKPPEKREFSIVITAGNKSPVGGAVIGGDLYQNCTINNQIFLIFFEQAGINPKSRITTKKEKEGKIVGNSNDIKKIWCEIFKGTIYDDRCLLKRSQTILGNKGCERCVLFENRELRNKLEELKSLWKKKFQRNQVTIPGKGIARMRLNKRSAQG